MRAAAAFLLAAALPAQRVVLENLAPVERQHWVTVTVPARLDLPVEMTFRVDAGRQFRAVRGVTIGGSTAVRIHASIGARERTEGRLVPEPHDSAGPFAPHPWVSDDPEEIIPHSVRYLLPDQPGEVQTSVVLEPELLEESPAHQLWHTRRRGQHGLVWDWWWEVLHDDPVVQVWGTVAWSDPADPGQRRTFRHVVVSVGEQLAQDFRVRHGLPVPNREGVAWGHMVARNWVADDGVALPISGALLAYASPESASVPLEASLEPLVASRRDLDAARHGPIVGLCLDWSASWGPVGHVPRLTPAGLARERQAADEAWRAFLAGETVTVGYGAPREMGAARTPSQTGAQEDFGAAKGAHAVTVGDPHWIRRAQYAYQAELLRYGYHHHELDGRPVVAAEHPRWTTYAGLTFFALAQDRLGKTTPPGSAALGWRAYDEEHFTWNGAAAYLSLAPDPSLLDHVGHMVTTLEADARTQGTGLGAARAQGRTMGAIAQLWHVSPEPLRARLLAVARKRLERIRANPSLGMTGPMDVLEWRQPDPRKPIYTDAARTQLAPWVSMWEHGLAAVGLQQLHEATGEGGDVLRIVSETLARYGWRRSGDGSYLTVADMLWSGGEDPPGWPGAPAPWQVTYGGGVDLWTRAGILVAREVLDRADLDAYIVATGGWTSTDRIRAEWDAAVTDPSR